jgi:hypothetical protein
MTSTACFNFPITSELHNKRLKQAIRRDVLFLTAGAIAYFIVAYVETHAADAEIRGNIIRSLSTEGDGDGANYCEADVANDNCTIDHDGFDPIKPNARPHKIGILDAGFILTSPLHRYLSQHRDVNDMLAMINSILLAVPLAYVIYVTVWKGDFTLSFRLISTHLFRSLCGWFT